MSNPFDALRKVINHEANQDDDGGFFAKLYGFQPEHDDDGPTARGLFQTVDFNRNSYVYRTSIPQHVWPKMPNIIGHTGHSMTTEEYLEAEKQRQEGMKLAAKYIRKRYGPKRKHAITVRKLAGWYGNFWKFSCTPCGLSFNYPTWETAYRRATHHAHNHHRSQK